jgi:hypothetical protein
MRESAARPRPARARHSLRMMSLGRTAWIATTGICAIAALLLLLNGYDGYSAVLLFVGLAAAVNLLP